MSAVFRVNSIWIRIPDSQMVGGLGLPSFPYILNVSSCPTSVWYVHQRQRENPPMPWASAPYGSHWLPWLIQICLSGSVLCPWHSPGFLYPPGLQLGSLTAFLSTCSICPWVCLFPVSASNEPRETMPYLICFIYSVAYIHVILCNVCLHMPYFVICVWALLVKIAIKDPLIANDHGTEGNQNYLVWWLNTHLRSQMSCKRGPWASLGRTSLCQWRWVAPFCAWDPGQFKVRKSQAVPNHMWCARQLHVPAASASYHDRVYTWTVSQNKTFLPPPFSQIVLSQWQEKKLRHLENCTLLQETEFAGLFWFSFWHCEKTQT